MVNSPAHPLVVRGLRKHYGRHQVLRGVELTVEGGAVHGLVGLNGAGKTTTLQCILGLLPYNAGAISLLGLPPKALHRAGGKVAVVFDEPCLHPQLTVGQTLAHAGLTVGRRDPAHLRRLEQLLGIERYHDFKIRELSLGNRRRTSIAQALVGEPAFLLLDEPFNGLDAGGVEDLLDLIRQLNREKGISFLLASHQLSYLERICSHMAVLHRGAIAVSDRIDQLLAAKQTRVELRVANPTQVRELLTGMAGVQVLEAELATGDDGIGLLRCEMQDPDTAALNRRLLEAGAAVYELARQRNSLDVLFRQITASDGSGAEASARIDAGELAHG